METSEFCTICAMKISQSQVTKAIILNTKFVITTFKNVYLSRDRFRNIKAVTKCNSCYYCANVYHQEPKSRDSKTKVESGDVNNVRLLSLCSFASHLSASL